MNREVVPETLFSNYLTPLRGWEKVGWLTFRPFSSLVLSIISQIFSQKFVNFQEKDFSFFPKKATMQENLFFN